MNDVPRTWFAVRVRPRAEIEVIDELRRVGLAGWAPMAKRYSAIGQTIVEPAFPGYVLAALPEPIEPEFGAVLGISDVCSFLGGERPEPIQAVAVSTLQVRERIGHFDSTRRGPAKLLRGRGLDQAAADQLVARLGRRTAAAAA